MAYIRELNENYVVAVAHLGYRSDGKVIQKQKKLKRPSNISKTRWLNTVHHTAVARWEENLKSIEIIKDDIRLDKFVDLWKNDVGEIHLRTSTYINYLDQLQRIILPSIGHHYLKDLRPIVIQRMINERAKDGVSRRTVKHPLEVLSAILSYAVKWGYLENNPCSKVDIPHIPQINKRKYFERDEVEKMMLAIVDEPLRYQAAFYLALSGGLRRGEILNLRCMDVEKDGVIVRIGKNDSSSRKVVLDEISMEILLTQRKEQLDNALAFGTQDWMFPSMDGGQMSKNTITSWMRRFTKKAGVNNLGLHALRHTSATILISAGVDIKTVSMRLGHSDTTTTLNIYTHMLKDKEKEAADKIGDYLHQGEKNGFFMGFSQESLN